MIPRDSANSRSITSTAAAPSLVCDEFPAVTLPRAAKTGRSFASASSEVSARGPSSVSKIVSEVRTLPPSSTQVSFTGSGTISSLNLPAAIAAAARRLERSAKASWSSRLISHCFATFSAVSPMPR